MSLGPYISKRIIVEQWNDIELYTPKAVCNICHGTENVKIGKIPVMNCALTHSTFSGNHFDWMLCLKCHEAGWKPPKEYYHGFFYFNVKTGESKSVS